eukprot:TRINITY_DN1108_c1_g1_i1.p1 TRINITY_DN1108_c1_g1~~TRINITY_DN1108_c1_g1_i1.p1  ORF type:complete len:2630 (+),score=493.94 TRINITY_DN1108_c1_g1_i1:44-7933(+)
MSSDGDLLMEVEKITGKEKEKEAENILQEILRVSTQDSFPSEMPARETTTTIPSAREQSLYLDPELCDKLTRIPNAEKENFVQYFLTAIGHNRGSQSDVIKEATTWIDANRANQSERSQSAFTDLKIRFSDGIDYAKSLEGLSKIDFWGPDYTPDCSVREMAQKLEVWSTPKGRCWSKEEVADVITLQNIESTVIAQFEKTAIPIYIYTSAMYRKVLWAVWVPSQERWSEIKYHAELEKEYRPHERSLTIKSKKALREIAAAYKVKMEHVDPSPSPIKDRFYNLDGLRGKLQSGDVYYLIRSTDEYDSVSPIKNSVAWVSSPEMYFNDPVFGIDAFMPPSRVFEYLESRPRDETTHRTQWNCKPKGTSTGDALIKECYAEPNQSTYNKNLHAKFIQLLDNTPSSGKTAPLRLIMNEKLKDSGQKPTPQDIAHALELQELEWSNNQGKKKTFVVGLSGFPRLIVDTAYPHACTDLFRVYHECIEQPYHLLNATMRNVQSGSAAVTIDIRTSKYRGHYVCKEVNPRKGNPVPLYQEPNKHRAIWKENETWCITHANGKSEFHVDYEDCKMKIGTWMLEDVRPLMWYLEKGLESIPLEKEIVKSYRGLADVTLARDIYSPGGLVMWGAYSSSSADQATATWFAMQEGSAAVFTLRGRSCKMIADYSRFAREMEYLYPPNICFQVKTMLTEDQQQILGREGLQLYELDEVDDLEALSIYITQNINSAITGQGMGLVNQLVSVIQALVNKELLDALEHAVAPSKPLLQKEYGMEMAKRLKVLAEQNTLPIDDDDKDGVSVVLNDSLISAASDGYNDAVEKLIELGANSDTRCADGWYPVEHALIGGHLNVTQLLLKHANLGTETEFVKHVDETGSTPLHRMAEAGHEKAVILLLRIGADPLARNKQKQTPAELAFAGKHTDLVHLLKPSQVLGEAEMQKMRKYWRSSHYSSDDRRSRFTESDKGVECVPYGIRTSTQAMEQKKTSEDSFAIAEGLKLWRTPKGEAWEGDAVIDLVEDARWTVGRKDGVAWRVAVPLFIHTASIYHTTIWAVWVAQPERVIDGWWKVIENTEDFEGAFATEGRSEDSLQLNQRCVNAIANTLTKTPDEVPKLFHAVNPKTKRGLYGFTTTSPGEECTEKDLIIFRFRAGDVQAARSFSSCVAWLPAPDKAFVNEDILPLFSVLEYIYSRTPTEPLKGKDGGKGWECCLAPSKDLPDIISSVRTRIRQHNPQTSDESDLELYKEVEERVNKLDSTLLTETFKAKIKPRNAHADDVVPTLDMISQALDIQQLTFKDGGLKFMLALTGPKKTIAYEILKDGTPEVNVIHLHRVCRPMGCMPSDYLGITAANLINDRTEIKLEIAKKSTMEYAGVYNLVHPGDDAESMYNQSRRGRRRGVRSTTTGPMLNSTLSFSGDLVGSESIHASNEFEIEADEFRRKETPSLSARWSRKRDAWIVITNSGKHAISAEDVTLHLGNYMTSSVRPLMMSVQFALDDMMIGSRPPPLYRASLNANLAKDTAIIWSSMISASESHTMVESMFKEDDGATIFTLSCTSAKPISDYSRFGREMEWAVPPNCVFERKDDNLIEANDNRALSLFIQDKISSLSAKTENSDVINQLLSAKQNLNQNNVHKALEIILEPGDPERPLIEDDDGFTIAKKTLQCGADPIYVTRALYKAAKEGYYKCVPHLMELGANVNAKEDSIGMTPVELAILGGHEYVIQHLRSCSSVSISLPDVRSYAASGEELAVLLIHTLEKSEGKAASVLVADRDGKFPINLANENGHKYTVYLLKTLMLEVGKSLREIDNVYSMSLIDVLREAIEAGESKAAMALLKTMDKVREKNGVKNCLHYASQKFTQGQGIQVLRELTRKGTPLINMIDQSSWSPLRYAVDAGNTQAVEILLAAGANPYIPDKHGNPITSQAKSDGTIRARLHEYFEDRWASAHGIYKHLRADVKEKLEELASMFLQSPEELVEVRKEYLFWRDDRGSINKVCYNFIANGPKGEGVDELSARITQWRSRFENSTENIQLHETTKRKDLTKAWLEAWDSLKADSEAEMKYMNDMHHGVTHGKRWDFVRIAKVLNSVLLFLSGFYVLLSVPYYIFANEEVGTLCTAIDAVLYSLYAVNFVINIKARPNTVEIDTASPSKEEKDDSLTKENDAEREDRVTLIKITYLRKGLMLVPILPLRAFGTNPLLRLNLLLGYTHCYKLNELGFLQDNVMQMSWVLMLACYVSYLTGLVQLAGEWGVCSSANTSGFWQCQYYTLRLFAGWDVYRTSTNEETGIVVLAVIVTLIGFATRALFIAAVIRLVETRNPRKKAYRDKVEEVLDCLSHAKPEVQQIALDYYKLCWRTRGTVDLVQTSEVLGPLYPLLQYMVESATAIEVKMKIPLLNRVTIDKLTDVISSFRYMLAPKGVMFFSQGDESTHMYFILSGSVEVYVGNHCFVARLSKGDYFGEVGLITKRKRNASVMASSDCELYQFDEGAFAELLSNKDVHSEIIKVASDRKHDSDPILNHLALHTLDDTEALYSTSSQTVNWDLDGVVSIRSADFNHPPPLPSQPLIASPIAPREREHRKVKKGRWVKPRGHSQSTTLTNPSHPSNPLALTHKHTQNEGDLELASHSSTMSAHGDGHVWDED